VPGIAILHFLQKNNYCSVKSRQKTYKDWAGKSFYFLPDEKNGDFHKIMVNFTIAGCFA